MKTLRTSHLAIVPSGPPGSEDPGASLGTPNGTLISDEAMISSALSLYFEWEDYRSAHIYLEENGKKKRLPCTLDYDRDERIPTELRIKTQRPPKCAHSNSFSNLKFYFEVFHVCYEGHGPLLALSENPDEDGWDLIIGRPTSLRVHKTRRLPRHDLKGVTALLAPSASWQSNTDTKPLPVQLMELGMQSVVVCGMQKPEACAGCLTIGPVKIDAKYVRSEEDRHIFVLSFKDHQTFGTFFDLFRSLVYPELKSRYQVDFETGFQLFKESGYFSKFGETDLTSYKDALFRTWSELKAAEHLTTADFYTTAEGGALTGASSAAEAFIYNAMPVWALHQMCAIKEPIHLKLSCTLYFWRVEYLCAMPEPFNVVSYFNGNSRWLERTFVKFATLFEGGPKLYPIRSSKVTVRKGDRIVPPSREIQRISFGNLSRAVAPDNEILLGFGPPLLNAGGNLNRVTALTKDRCVDTLIALAEELLVANDQSEGSFRISVPASSLEELPGEPFNENRVIIIPKEDLPGLISCVEHSIAVTERKYAINTS